MKLFNVFFNYYFLFYKKVLKDAQPVFTSVFTFTFSMSLFINGVINIVLAHWMKIHLDKWIMILIFIILMVISYFYYYRKNKAELITKENPKLFNNHSLSILVTIIFFIFTASFLFWEPVYTRDIIEGK